MIVVTGAAGFIGSCLVGRLNREGQNSLVIVDAFSNPVKEKNLLGKTYFQKIDREEFHAWLDKNHNIVDMIFHIGA